MAVDAGKYFADATMLDGAAVRIRAIRPDDKERLHEHFKDSASSQFIFGSWGFGATCRPTI